MKSENGVSSAETTIVCSKCQTICPRGQQFCKCGAHLYITCRKCGKGNPRVATECKACGARLPTSGFRKFRRAFRTTPRAKVVVRVITCVAAIVVCWLLLNAL